MNMIDNIDLIIAMTWNAPSGYQTQTFANSRIANSRMAAVERIKQVSAVDASNHEDLRAPDPDPAADRSGTISQLFTTPVARITHPNAAQFNDGLAETLLARSASSKNKFDYKSETTANLAEWGEPVIDRLTTWTLRMARQFVETVIGTDLDSAFSQGNFNTDDHSQDYRRAVSLAVGTSWASIYRNGDLHEPHFHPNTAIAAIYYVAAPSVCELDLVDPRPNISYFDPGITFASEDQQVRLRCWPGELVMFPGWLKHSVPPFTEDSVRISISWNLGYTTRRIQYDA